MKLVAQSVVPSRVPYTHLGYLAAPGVPMGKVGMILGLGIVVLVAMMTVLKRMSGL
ncbi:MAG: hypothetical protein ACYSU0_15845 [Planctomycetota bacterium]|jgi:hypothetical protein